MSDSNRSSASQAQRATLYTTFSSATPTGIEPVLPERQSGVLTAILWGYVLGYVLWLPFEAMFWRAGSTGKHLSGYVLAGRQCRQIKRPPVWLDKRQSQQLILEFVWSSHGSLWSTWSQTSTWSGHIKAYTNKPFRIFDGRHNCSLKIKHAICIFVCSILQHCLSFPDLLSFFLRLIYHLRFGLSFNLWYKLVTGTVPMSPHVTLCLIYYYLRNKLEKSSALRLKKHI